MTVEQLFQQMIDAFPALAEAGKIFFDHITVEDGDEITPPYIVLTETQSDPFFADNTTYYLTVANAINLYTAEYDVAIMQSIEEFLNVRKIPFTRNTEWLDEIAEWLTIYGVNLGPSEVES